jgi:DNA-binding Xre family transcriptional regulator
MIHRHLDIPEDTPAEELGLAAIDDILDRGELSDWAPLARAVGADPHGRLAESVLQICNAHPMYGTSALWTSWIEQLRAPAAVASSTRFDLASLRRSRGLSQAALAQRLGITQSDVSKLERRSDIRLSTLRSAVEALGGTLKIQAQFPDGTEADLTIGSAPEAR